MTPFSELDFTKAMKQSWKLISRDKIQIYESCTIMMVTGPPRPVRWCW